MYSIGVCAGVDNSASIKGSKHFGAKNVGKLPAPLTFPSPWGNYHINLLPPAIIQIP